MLAAAVFVMAGCSTIFRAREAQDSVVQKGSDAAKTGVVARLDLAGYSLERLVDFAMTNRPSLVTKRLAVRDARLALKQLAADAPVLSETPWTAAHLSAVGGYNESSDGVTVGGGQGFRTDGNGSFGLSLDLLVYDFGRYDAQAKAQAETVLAAEQDLVNEGYVVFGEVASSFFLFNEKRALLAVALTNVNEYAEHLLQAEGRLAAGEAQKLDVLKARVDLASARQTVVTVSNLVMTSGAQLMNALGIDAAHGTVDDVMDIAPLSLDSVCRGFARTAYGVDEAYAFACTNAPSVRMARARLRAASHDVDYAIANLKPSVSLTSSFSWADPFWFWAWGVNATQSLFEGFRRTTAVDRAVVAMESAASAVDEAEQALSVKLETAIADRDNAEQKFATARATVQSANENLTMVREQFVVGASSRIELSEAIASHSTALGDCVTAFYEGQIAEAALFRILGSSPVYKEEKVGSNP